MERRLPSEANELLKTARKLREQAAATTMQGYRAKLLKLAREVEEKATEIDARPPGEGD